MHHGALGCSHDIVVILKCYLREHVESSCCIVLYQKALVCPACDKHTNDPVPLVEKSRALCPGARFPPNIIHQVIIIPGLNKL